MKSGNLLMCYPYGEEEEEEKEEEEGGAQHVSLYVSPINQFTFSVIFP